MPDFLCKTCQDTEYYTDPLDKSKYAFVYKCPDCNREALFARIAWYQGRLDMLLHEQDWMRDPERTLLCDIIANGALLPDPDGKRYGGHHA